MRPQLIDLTNNQAGEGVSPAEYQKSVICTKLAGKAVVRVVKRCNDAKENENLDLSDCQLMQIPEAVFHLLRATNLKTCDLSFNVITKIPPKVATKFSCITDLNISNNRISKLPDELVQLLELKNLDISFNSFVSLPRITYSLPKLESVNAEKNYIADVDVTRLTAAPCLKFANFKQNPLSSRAHDALSAITKISVQLSTKPSDDWDDDF